MLMKTIKYCVAIDVGSDVNCQYIIGGYILNDDTFLDIDTAFSKYTIQGVIYRLVYFESLNNIFIAPFIDVEPLQCYSISDGLGNYISTQIYSSQQPGTQQWHAYIKSVIDNFIAQNKLLQAYGNDSELMKSSVYCNGSTIMSYINTNFGVNKINQLNITDTLQYTTTVLTSLRMPSPENISANAESMQDKIKNFYKLHPNIIQVDLPEEERSIDTSKFSLDSIPRPIKLDTMEVDIQKEKGLFIPRDTVPDFIATKFLLNSMCQLHGIPFSKSMLQKKLVELKDKMQLYLNKVILKELNKTYVDFEVKSINDVNVHMLIMKRVNEVLGDNTIQIKDHVKSGKVSFVQDDARFYMDKLLVKLEDLKASCTHQEQIANVQRMYELISALHSYKQSLAIYKQFKDMISVDRLDFSGIDCEVRNEEDLVLYRPGINLLQTNRFSSEKPNIQGKNIYIKSCMRAPKGYKIASLDISAQDVYSLVWGIMEDEKLKELVLEYVDPYLAILARLNLTPNADMKRLCKVPVLSIMNGKSKNSLKYDKALVGNYDVAEKIYNYITSDSGYRKITDKCREDLKDKSSIFQTRCGLFGSERIMIVDDNGGKDRGHPFRQKLNGYFQITSAELLCISYQTLQHDLLNNKIPKVTASDIIPLIPIYDELIVLYRDDGRDELYQDIIRYYMLPQVEGWGRMSGGLTAGDYYSHK